MALLINHGDTIQSITQTSMMTSLPQYDEEWFPTCVQLVHSQRYQLYRVWSNLKRQQNDFNWPDSHFLQLQQAHQKIPVKSHIAGGFYVGKFNVTLSEADEEIGANAFLHALAL